MADLEQFQMLIGGKYVEAVSGKTFDSQNPYTGQSWARMPDGAAEDVDAAVAAARAALDGEWGPMTGFGRAKMLRRLGDLIGENAEQLARLEVNDSGKLYREMIGQLNGLGGWYHYFAGLADKIEGRQIPSPNPNYLVYTRREPVGVVAAITPWNSPLLLMTWKLAPGAGGRLHDRDQAVGALPRVDARLRDPDRGSRIPSRRRQRRHRAVPGDRRTRWPRTPTSTRSRSRAPPLPAGQSRSRQRTG